MAKPGSIIPYPESPSGPNPPMHDVVLQTELLLTSIVTAMGGVQLIKEIIYNQTPHTEYIFTVLAIIIITLTCSVVYPQAVLILGPAAMLSLVFLYVWRPVPLPGNQNQRQN